MLCAAINRSGRLPENGPGVATLSNLNAMSNLNALVSRRCQAKSDIAKLTDEQRGMLRVSQACRLTLEFFNWRSEVPGEVT
jgi:hypothetical protein